MGRNPACVREFLYMIGQLLATKSNMSQAWTKSGVRIPVTVVKVDNFTCIDAGKKSDRILAGQAIKKLKNIAKAQSAVLKKNGLSFGFRQVKEVVVDAADKERLVAGTVIKPSEVLKVGDIVKVTGTSKGKGFTGVVKRHGFKGGPRTHGQSDRERAPGAIGSGTTPGRVYRNKRMAGRSGNAQVTTLGLTIISVNDANGEIMLKGIVPGTINSLVTLTKTGESQFEGIIEKEVKAEAAPVESEAPQAPVEAKVEEA